MTSLHFAPVQGHTDAAYRHFHAKIYNNNLEYYTPFIRLEKDGLRTKDIKDITSDLNFNHKLIPQIIFRNSKELTTLVSLLREKNINRIDLNMGCPFPLQTGHGRGAAAINNEPLAQDIVKCVKDNTDITFSIKMRLGLQDPEEWKSLIPYLNQMDLQQITLHPRIAKQQYSGELYMEQFSEFLKQSKNPVIYNGDIKSVEDIHSIVENYPSIEGIMIARGLLGRPSLLSEFIEGKEWDKSIRISKLLEFHRVLFNHYSTVLCGEKQIISKIQPFWEYMEEEIGRKPWKAIKKASSLSKYQTAIAMIE